MIPFLYCLLDHWDSRCTLNRVISDVSLETHAAHPSFLVLGCGQLTYSVHPRLHDGLLRVCCPVPSNFPPAALLRSLSASFFSTIL